jgi:HK97 family phage prohead protease
MKQESTTVQTLIFSKEKFTQQQAIDWAKQHDYRVDKVDETEDSYRLRQREPGDFQEGSFRTINLTEGVSAVIGRLKMTGDQIDGIIDQIDMSTDMNIDKRMILDTGNHVSHEDAWKPSTATLTSVWDPGKKEKKHLTFPSKVKALDQDEDVGTFEGYGAVFGNTDRHNEVIMPGAFRRSLLENGMPSLIWQHDSKQPIGIYTSVKEDEHGLYVRGQLNLFVQKGKEAWQLLKQGALSGLSVGFITQRDKIDEETGTRQLEDIDLFEISLVTFPANPMAKVVNVKEWDERQYEKFLRDAGFSRKDSKTLTAHGFKSILEDQRDADSEWDEFIASVKSLNDILKKQ